MRHKNDIALAATSARSYNRHWRARKLSWNDIGKIKYLFDGAEEYMDEVLTDAHQTWQRHKEGSLKEYALNMLVLASAQM